MDEPIDSEINSKKRTPPYRLINTLLIFGILLFISYTYSQIEMSKNSMDSPFLPTYIPYSINNTFINVSAFLFMSLFPALFLRIKKRYIISSICILIFAGVGVFLKDNVLIYQYFV